MDDVFTKEEVWYVDAFRKDPVQYQHLGLGMNRHPAHVAVFEVVQNRDIVVLEYGHVAVEIFALEGIRDDGLVLHAGELIESARFECADGALQLPWRGIGSRKGEMPANVVFENGVRLWLQVVLHAR